MLKERAQSAHKHGLPAPPPPTGRQRASELARVGVQAASAARVPVARQRMPLFVKLLGLGLGLLAVIYVLTLLRDHDSKFGSQQSTPPAPSPVR